MAKTPEYKSLSTRELVERHTHREVIDHILDELRKVDKTLDESISTQNFYMVSGAHERLCNVREMLQEYEGTHLKGLK